jgi:hypothetical protein
VIESGNHGGSEWSRIFIFRMRRLLVGILAAGLLLVALTQAGVGSKSANFPAIARGIQDIWREEPGLILLLAFGFVVFVLIVLDTWWLKKRRRRKQPREH